MTHDDITHPDIVVKHLQPVASPAEVSLAINQITDISANLVRRVGNIAEQAEGIKESLLSANAGIDELHRQFARDRRNRNTLSIVLGACATVLAAAIIAGGSIITNHASAAAREQAQATATIVVERSQKSTESVASAAGREGGLTALREYEASRPPAPMLKVTK
jgi:hypothetical protein